MYLFLPAVYVVRDGRLYFHFVCQSTPDGEGVPWPGPDRGGGTPARGTCSGYPRTRSDGGTPARGGPPWVPPPRDRTAYGVLATQLLVCLLRSRGRTFLFILSRHWMLVALSVQWMQNRKEIPGWVDNH